MSPEHHCHGSPALPPVSVPVGASQPDDPAARSSRAERLRQAQKMEALGQLAGGIAHDFNNLLTAIIGSAEMLRLEVRANDAATALVDEILQASDRAASLTRQLLAYGRRQVLHPRLIEPGALIAEMAPLLRRLIGEHIDITCRTPRDAGCVRMDPGQLQQVILNLALNARDAMPDGGVLSLETAGLQIEAPDPETRPGLAQGSYVAIVVRDTGTGMDDATKARVFEPFFTTRAGTGGTGLGLSTVYGVVKQSRGYVYADSEPGRGATFTVLLPRVNGVPERVAPPVQDLPPRPARSRRVVLVAEDDDAVRRIVQATLERCGYEVEAVARGDEARARAAGPARPIDLLVTDVVLPGLAGLALWREVHARHPQARVLFMSGYARDAFGAGEPAEIEEADHLPKPFTPSQLAERVRKALGDG